MFGNFFLLVKICYRFCIFILVVVLFREILIVCLLKVWRLIFKFLAVLIIFFVFFIGELVFNLILIVLKNNFVLI